MKLNGEISVTFLKDKDGLWHSYTAYAEDVDCETMVKFMDCIGNAVDALNKKGGDK
jgi:hypothetical protein